MHPDRQFLVHLWFICLRICTCCFVLFRVACHLPSNRGCEGAVIWGFFRTSLVQDTIPKQNISRKSPPRARTGGGMRHFLRGQEIFENDRILTEFGGR